jgi:plastocyanin
MKKLFAAAVLSALVSAPALAETKVFELVIKDHKFSPETLQIPANEKVKLVVKNQDASAEEFESNDFNREKVIAGNSEAVVFIDPLSAGEYKFFGEFNPKTAQGKLVVK